MSTNDDEKEGIKVILLGEAFVGKTSLIKVAIGQSIDLKEIPTLSSSYSEKEFNYNGKKYIFNLWDTIGQEKYRSLTNMFFNDSKIIILVYDITDKKTFEQLTYWYNQVETLVDEQNIILAIVGNKKDLYDHEQVTEDQGKKFAKEKNAKFKLSSAKEDPLNFNEFLEELFKEFIDTNKKIKITKKGIKLNQKKDEKSRKCCKD